MQFTAGARPRVPASLILEMENPAPIPFRVNGQQTGRASPFWGSLLYHSKELIAASILSLSVSHLLSI